MTPAQRKQIKTALVALLEELLSRGSRPMQPLRTDELDRSGEDDEQPLAQMQQAIASNRNRNDAAMVERVQAALQRLAEDPEDFGNCQDCGDEVPLSRLRAMPYAEFCVDCQSKNDPRGRATRTKLTDFR